MVVTKDQVMAALPNMGQSDLIAIKTLAGALITQQAPSPQDDPTNAQGWLFVAMQTVLGPDCAYMPPATVNQFNKAAPVFTAFVAANFEWVMHKKLEAIACMSKLVELVADDLKAKKVPVTMLTVTNNLPRIREIFDNAFPGYIASGLTPFFHW